MSNYTKTTNFATKDALVSGNPAKIVKGTEIDTEFNNISVASGTKADKASPTFTGTVTLPITTAASLSVGGDGVTVTGIKDEDDMASNSATKLASQQSIKAYVDSQVTAQDLDVTDGTTSISIDLDSEALSLLGGTGVTSTALGNGVTLAIDATVATLDDAQTLTNKTLTTPAITGALTTDSTIDGRDVAVDGTKLDGIEALADVTDVTNVTAAGALMDSELTSIASVKALDQGVATTDSPTFVGLTTSGEITANGGIALGDNDKATFGASDDLQIFHNGTESFIREVGEGGLKIDSNGPEITLRVNATENALMAESNGAVTVYYNNVAKLATTATGIDVTGDVSLPDNGKATFGAGSDLQIYHDGGNSLIEESGVGNLIIRGSGNVDIQPSGGGAYMARFAAGGASSLYYNGAAKFSTTSSGIDVTGTATMDGLVVSSTGSSSITQTHTDGNVVNFAQTGTGGTIDWRNANGGALIRTGDASRLLVGSSGDVSFYEDTGTAAKLFWDASAESLGIGTTTPSNTLEVAGNAKFTNASFGAFISPYGDDTYINMLGSGRIQFRTDGSEAMRIDSSGNLLVGTTDTTPYNNGLNSTVDKGIALLASGFISAANYNGSALDINRTGTDGNIANFYKSGAPVGSIGVRNGNNLTVGGTVAGHIGLQFGTAIIYPTDNTGAANNNAVALGDTNNRFSNLYLSGTAYVGTSVGIGVVPSSVLHAAGSTGLTLGAVSADVWQTAAIKPIDEGSQYKGSLAFYTHASAVSAGSPTERMRIDSAGNVGIGTSSPTAPLTIGYSGAGAQLQLNNSGNNRMVEIGAYSANEGIVRLFNSSNVETVRIAAESTAGVHTYFNGGNVGIGTNSPSAKLTLNDAGQQVGIDFKEAGTTRAHIEYDGTIPALELGTNGSSNVVLKTANTERMRIDANGKIFINEGVPFSWTDSSLNVSAEIYGDSSDNLVFRNTAAKAERMRIDASGNVGIGTSSPNSYAGQTTLNINSTGVARLDLDIGNTMQGYLLAESGYTGLFTPSGSNSLRFGTNSTERMRITSAGNVGIGTNSPLYTAATRTTTTINGASSANLSFGVGGTGYGNIYVASNTMDIGTQTAANPINFTIGGATKATLDASGNLLVGQTIQSPNTVGVSLNSNGNISAKRNGGIVGLFNRGTSDGTIVDFRKDGEPVGSIGVAAGPVAYMVLNSTTSDNVAALKGSGAAILPSTNLGADKDGTMSLGSSGARFKDLHLSGGVYLGGTGAANKLDDYEEGTWTGTLTGGTSAPSTAVTATGTYTKVGKVVTAVILFSNKDSTGVSGGVLVTGLPFTASAGGIGAVWGNRLSTATNGVVSYISSNNDLVIVNGLGNAVNWASAGTGTYSQYSITYEV